MCDPVTIAGIALTGAASAANSYGQSQAQKARDDALAAERIRQRRFDQEAQVLNTRSRERYDDFGGQQDVRSGELGDYFAGQKIEQGSANEAASAEMARSQLPASASGITVAEEGKQRGQATQYAEQQGQALGELRSFGDLMGEIGRSTGRDASLLNQIGGFKQGSSNVLPYELDAASKKGSGAKTLGDILGLAGNTAVAAGVSGAIRPEMIAGWFDPSVKVVGKGVLPVGGPASYSKGDPAPSYRLYP